MKNRSLLKIECILTGALIALLVFGCKSAPEPETLHELILQERYGEAKERLGDRENVNAVDENGDTPLHLTARQNEADLSTFLIIKGADTSIVNNEGDTPLLTAIKSDAMDAARAIMMKDTNIFAKDAEGNTAIELALANGEQWTELLITPETGKLTDENGQTIVHYFVRTLNEAGVEACIRQNVPLSTKDNAGNSPLALAFQMAENDRSVGIAVQLIRAGAELVRGDFAYFEDAVKTHNVILRFHDAQTPLHIATILGHTGIVNYILTESGSIRPKDLLSAQDISGATPLHEAVRYGREDIVNLLLEAGAQVDALDSIGKTPFLLIIPPESQMPIYTTLLEHGANIGQKDIYGDSVLHIATMGATPIDVLTMLVEKGAQVNERNKKGVTPLALAVEKNLGAHVLFYANAGGDIYAEDMERNTPLTLALDSPTIEMLQTLITKENVLTKDSSGNTPLHTAILHDAPFEYIQYLVDMGADVNAFNKDGDTVLYLATQKNTRKAGELLLDKGADIFASNRQNYSPLRLALETGGETQDWLITSKTMNATDGSGNTPLHYAAEWKLDRAIVGLIQKGAKVNATNSNGETALFSATRADSASTINVLVENGITIDARSNLTRDHLGNTPLHTASTWNALEAAQTLLSFGMDVNAQNLSGKTPLSECCRAGKTEMATLLLRKGANVNATDATGRTILMDAVQAKNEKMVALLLNFGANPQIQDMAGRNAYHEAANTTNETIIVMIRNAGGNPLSRDSYGETPFSIILRSNDEYLIRIVLGSNMMIVDSDGNTPIHIAVERNVSAKLLTMLLNMGFPVSQRNAKGVTPLYEAVVNNQRSHATALLERGADPFIATTDGDSALLNAITKKDTPILDAIVKYCGTKADMQGDTILHYAARSADYDTTMHLLSLNLDKRAKNISGETPSDIATRWGRGDIAELLK